MPTCPKCGLLNPPSALRCDCGYDFKSRTVERSYATSAPAPAARPGTVARVIVGLFLGALTTGVFLWAAAQTIREGPHGGVGGLFLWAIVLGMLSLLETVVGLALLAARSSRNAGIFVSAAGVGGLVVTLVVWMFLQ